MFSGTPLAGEGTSSRVGATPSSGPKQQKEVWHQGAKQIGRGNVGPGFREMFTGIGHTVVEGAKFSGNTMGEFFKRTFGS